MAQEKAPYIRYMEDVEKSGFSNDAEIPLFIGKSLRYKGKQQDETDSPYVKEITKFSKLSQVVYWDKLGAETKLEYKKQKTEGTGYDYAYVSSASEASKLPTGYEASLDSSSKQITKQDTFVSLIADFVEENTQYGADEEVLYFYVLDLPESADITTIVQKISDSKSKKDISVIVLDLEDDTYTSTGAYDSTEGLTSDLTSIASELNTEIAEGILRIAYCGLDKVGTDAVYAERVATVIEKLSSKTGSPRIGLMEKELMGKTVARICTTPYYIEPGYDSYKSVSLGTFDERTPDIRDSLFNAGLIFNEDDYTQGTGIPRMCLATSCAWGVEDKDTRRADALIHARRNVDYQVRQILKLVAPQLKRNETSVNIAFVRTDVLNYLAEQKRLGRLVDYTVSVEESDANPYQLYIYGSMIPVNSTMAIEFSNYVGSPVAIAEDYV